MATNLLILTWGWRYYKILAFSWDITKWCKVYAKTDSWFQKSFDEFGQLQTSSGKSKKMKFNGLLPSKKYIPLAKILCKEDLCNNSFNYLCENSPNYLCDFWNHKFFFTTQLLCNFLAQIWHTFQRINLSKCKFSDFPLLAIKFAKFLMPFFKQKVNFSLKFGSFFSVMRDHSSVLA